MANIKEKDLPTSAGITSADYFRIVTSGGASEKASAAGILGAIGVEDISSKITFGSAWTSNIRKAYLIGGKFVFFTLEGYASTIVAGTQYTIATIASGYKPKDTLTFTGHATNSNFFPQSIVNCFVWTSGDITVRCQNGNGNNVFISGWYALA